MPNNIDQNELSLEILPRSDSAARLIMEWRNDPHTLRMFFTGQKKTWPAFKEEFLRDYFSDAGLPGFFVIHEGQRKAFLRLRRIHNPWKPLAPTCDISVNVMPDMRGRGLGKAGIKLACEQAAAMGIREVVAEIKVENPESAQAFKSAGFLEVDTITKVLPDGKAAPVKRFVWRNAGQKFFSDEKVFIIAEAGSNWRVGNSARDKKMGLQLIEAAKESGADAVKFQTYRAETVYVANAGSSDYLEKAGNAEDISAIFKDLEMPYELLEVFAEHSKKLGIEFMSTPFSERDFDAIDPHVRIHKIASYEISHSRLIEAAARSGKPLIMSTGASQPGDIQWAADYFRALGGKELCIMQCTAKYPSPLSALNLRTIPWLERQFRVVPGFSDHSRDPISGPLAAVALGAKVIEKHFTFSNRLPGPDHAFAITFEELCLMVREIRKTEDTLGTGIKEVLPEERELASYARRGVQTTAAIKCGDKLREGENIAILRPGKQSLGVHPKHLPELEGKSALRDLSPGEGIKLGDWQD